MKAASKALINNIIGALPLNASIYYFLQRHIQKSIPISEKQFNEKRELAKLFLELYLEHHTSTPNAYLEFGAGRDLAIPLTLYKAGCRNQTIFDIQHLLKRELININMERLALPSIHSLNDLSNMNIDYHVNIHPAHTNLSENHFDFITSTSTLEHIPQDKLGEIFKEIYRLLKPGGIMINMIDMQDHYSYQDKSISYYNFLTYSKSNWKWYNSKFLFQNRLRHLDYIQLFKQAGFNIIDDKPTLPKKEDLAIIEGLVIDNHFKNYTAEELGTRTTLLVLQKPS